MNSRFTVIVEERSIHVHHGCFATLVVEDSPSGYGLIFQLPQFIRQLDAIGGVFP
ncbi:hypothetical protein ACPUEK_10250 [Marinomonas gallaica]|uniref:hypothetical protein n=1 Tax=Marinomonas gallaica TaxID=1806667 RepID=UPI003CE57CB7